MSAAKHILVPRQYSADAVPRDRALLARFHHMTTEERDALRRAHRIERLGPKLWRLREVNITGPATDTGKGLVSLEIEDKAIFQALSAELHGASLCG